MATIDVSPDVRSRLRQFLVERFNMSELKNLSFDLGVDYEMFPHQTKGELSRELLAYFERKKNLSCLVAEMAKQRPDEELVALLSELGSCSPRSKVQIVLPADKLKNRDKLLADLAKVLGVATDEVMLIATAPGSIRLLVSLPAEATEELLALNPDRLGDEDEITSIKSYDSLSPEEQAAWRKAAVKGTPPAGFLGLSGLPLVLAIVVGGILIAGALLVATTAALTPRVEVRNECADDINESQQFPIIGNVSINIESGESKTFIIPPGDYEFRYDGETIRVRVPVIGALPGFSVTGELDTLYENRPLPTNRTLRDSIELRGQRSIVLCAPEN